MQINILQYHWDHYYANNTHLKLTAGNKADINFQEFLIKFEIDCVNLFPLKMFLTWI